MILVMFKSILFEICIIIKLLLTAGPLRYTTNIVNTLLTVYCQYCYYLVLYANWSQTMEKKQ